MKRKLFIKVLSIMSLMALLAPFSCKTEDLNLKRAILGKWIAERDSLEFFKDGTVIARNGQSSINGTYEVVGHDKGRVEKDVIIVSLNSLGEFALPMTGKLLDAGTALMLTKSNGSAKKFIKNK